MDENKHSFMIYTDLKETLDRLTNEQVGILFRAIMDYQVTGEDPNLDSPLDFIFIPIRQQMDRDAAKWDHKKEVRAEAGRKGGIKSGEVRNIAKQNEANEANASKAKQNEANEAVNVNVNGNVNGNGNVNVPEMSGIASSSVYLIKHLNEKAGTNYNVTLSVEHLISDLFNEGYTVDQIRTVIDKKCAEWMPDEKMRAYLRPSTLFGDKFGEYLAAPISLVAERQQRAEADRAALERTLTEKRQALSDMRDSLSGADRTERRYLREQIAILEDSIGLIEKRIGGVA